MRRCISLGRPVRMLYCTVVLLFFTAPASAQPGGGGGLRINNLYTKALQQVNLDTDNDIQIRTFVLKGNEVHHETFLFDAYRENNGKMRISRSMYGFGLPPTSDVDEDGYSDRVSNQRMLIIYNRDTMVTDFMGITGENAGGYSDEMDSLVIQKGYFTYYRSRQQKENSYNYAEQQRVRKYLQNGLTPYTVPPLLTEGYLQYEPVTDISFLHKTMLPASYYFKRAAWLLQHKRPAGALTDIATGIEKNGGTSCEALYLLTGAYAALGQYQEAVDNISLAMDCRQVSWYEPWENKVEHYKTRIGLLIKLGQYDKALKDHDTIVAISKYVTPAVIDRADFRSRYLHDNTGAKNDLVNAVNAIPADHLNDRPQGTSEYAPLYFALGNVEAALGDIYAATKHWLKAEEFGAGVSSSDEEVRFFDSVIQRHTNIPGLYLSLALAQFKRGPYLGWGDATTSCFELSLNNINQAERTGANDYRINMYRARVLMLLQRYNEAIKEIDIAILKNNTDPRCFLFRYEIRTKLGQTKWGDNSDVDYQEYLKLLKTWRWDIY